MEVDSIHRKIEEKLKKRIKIRVPSEFEHVIKEDRKMPSRYHAEALKHSVFMDYENASSIRSIRPGKKIGDE